MPVLSKDGRHVLFIHVPKAGGTTVERTFRVNGWEMSYVDTGGEGSLNRVRRCSPQHMHAAMLRSQFRLKEFDHIFVVVRNPLDRFRSEFLWRNPGAGIHVRTVDRWVHEVLDRVQERPFMLDNHLRPQTEFLVRGAAVHRLEDGMETLLAALDSRLDGGLGKRVRAAANASERVHRVSSAEVPLSRRVRRRLGDFYAADFDQLGYQP